MHDDLRSNLSKILLLTEVLKSHVKDATEKSELEKIAQSTQEALEKMSEIVWSLNPKNDKLANLFWKRIIKHATPYERIRRQLYN